MEIVNIAPFHSTQKLPKLKSFRGKGIENGFDPWQSVLLVRNIGVRNTLFASLPQKYISL